MGLFAKQTCLRFYFNKWLRFFRHCTTLLDIVPAILCGQSRRLKSDESMTMSEYFAFLLPFTIQFISLTSHIHQYDGTQCKFISFTIVDKMFATNLSVYFNGRRTVLPLLKK